MITCFVGQKVRDLNIDHLVNTWINCCIIYLLVNYLGSICLCFWDNWYCQFIVFPMTKYYSVITLVLNKCTSIFHLLYLAMIMCVFTLQYCLIDVHRMNLSWNLFHPSINFKLGLQKERFSYWNKNGGWSGGRLP